MFVLILVLVLNLPAVMLWIYQPRREKACESSGVGMG